MTNITTEQTLFLLPTSEGVFITFQTVNTAEQIISGVDPMKYVVMKKYMQAIGLSTADFIRKGFRVVPGKVCLDEILMIIQLGFQPSPIFAMIPQIDE